MAADMGCRAGRWAVSAEGVMCPPRGQSRKARPSCGVVSGGSWAGNAELLIPAAGGLRLVTKFRQEKVVQTPTHRPFIRMGGCDVSALTPGNQLCIAVSIHSC